MKKWKFCYYTMLNYEKVERFLSKMESEGYILDSRRFFYFFKFRKIKPKQVDYFLTFSPSGGSISMYDVEHCLKSECGAALVVSNAFQAPAIYRVCDLNKDLHSLRSSRNSILRQIYLRQSIGCFCATTFWELLFFVLKNYISENWIAHLLLTIPVFVFAVYNLIGYFTLRLKLNIGKKEKNK